MKKLITISFALILSVTAWSQCALTYSFSPSSFTAEDQFTLTIDVTGTPVAGLTDLYLWSWSNAGDAYFNTAWDNSPEDAKLTHVSGNIFTITGSGVVWYQKSPGQLTQMQFLVKTKTGNVQSCDIAPVKFDPIEFIPSKMRVFPAKVGYNDVVSVYFHQDLATILNEQRMTPTKAVIVAYDENDNELTPASVEINLRKENTTTWRASFKPNYSFTGNTPAKFRYRFKGTIVNSNNEVVEVLTDFEEVVLTKLK
ncbi:hypothetical protein [Gynurincola endophyticus]|uniref:hypothetical protein n=1 Tax=Gynurincola endophyticus TaxID=2479004 RepID=UPI000F8EA101|nr:hypothetical protein [Gynurincola endophyticus]